MPAHVPSSSAAKFLSVDGDAEDVAAVLARGLGLNQQYHAPSGASAVQATPIQTPNGRHGPHVLSLTANQLRFTDSPEQGSKFQRLTERRMKRQEKSLSPQTAHAENNGGAGRIAARAPTDGTVNAAGAGRRASGRSTGNNGAAISVAKPVFPAAVVLPESVSSASQSRKTASISVDGDDDADEGYPGQLQQQGGGAAAAPAAAAPPSSMAATPPIPPSSVSANSSVVDVDGHAVASLDVKKQGDNGVEAGAEIITATAVTRVAHSQVTQATIAATTPSGAGAGSQAGLTLRSILAANQQAVVAASGSSTAARRSSDVAPLTSSRASASEPSLKTSVSPRKSPAVVGGTPRLPPPGSGATSPFMRLRSEPNIISTFRASREMVLSNGGVGSPGAAGASDGSGSSGAVTRASAATAQSPGGGGDLLGRAHQPSSSPVSPSMVSASPRPSSTTPREMSSMIMLRRSMSARTSSELQHSRGSSRGSDVDGRLGLMDGGGSDALSPSVKGYQLGSVQFRSIRNEFRKTTVQPTSADALPQLPTFAPGSPLDVALQAKLRKKHGGIAGKIRHKPEVVKRLQQGREEFERRKAEKKLGKVGGAMSMMVIMLMRS